MMLLMTFLLVYICLVALEKKIGVDKEELQNHWAIFFPLESPAKVAEFQELDKASIHVNGEMDWLPANPQSQVFQRKY